MVLKTMAGNTVESSIPSPSSKKFVGKRRPPSLMWRSFLKIFLIALMYAGGFSVCMALAALMLIVFSGDSL